MGAQPFFQAGDIILVGGAGAHPQLKAEILNFPSGKRDILNALAYFQRVFAGSPVYEEFGEWHVIDGYEPSQQHAMALCFNAAGADTTAALIVIEGERMVVVADWITPAAPAQVVPDVAQLVRAAFPRARVTAWLPADVLDQADRMAIVPALRAAKLNPMRGGYVSVARGALSPGLRTESRGKRLFLVDQNATHTLSALAGGYNYPVTKSGKKESLPEQGPHRTLMEGIEAAVYVLCSRANDVLPDGVHTAVNPQGASYLTSLPRR